MQSYQEKLELYMQTEDYQRHQIYLEAFNHRRQSLGITIRPGTNAPYISDPAPIAPQPVASDEKDSDGDQEMILDTYDFGPEGQLHDSTSPVKSGMTEVRTVANALGINPHITRVAAYPTEDMTTKAVEDFLNGTGSLLYLWDRDEAFALIKSVYHPHKDDGTPVHATEVFAMATVGSYCDGKTGMRDYAERFLHFFMCLLSSHPAICDLQRMRLFVCLAIFRFTNNVQSARKLMCK